MSLSENRWVAKGRPIEPASTSALVLSVGFRIVMGQVTIARHEAHPISTSATARTNRRSSRYPALHCPIARADRSTRVPELRLFPPGASRRPRRSNRPGYRPAPPLGNARAGRAGLSRPVDTAGIAAACPQGPCPSPGSRVPESWFRLTSAR